MSKIGGPYTIPDSHVALIGRVADAWAQLEFQIDIGIWELSATEQQLAACITSQFLSVHPRLRAFTALVSVRGGSAYSIKALNKFTASVSGLSDKRNRAVHDPRYKDGSTEQIHRLEITAKPKVHFGFICEPESELNETIDKIYEKVNEFIELRTRVLCEIEALPPESQPTLLKIMPLRK